MADKKKPGNTTGPKKNNTGNPKNPTTKKTPGKNPESKTTRGSGNGKKTAAKKKTEDTKNKVKYTEEEKQEILRQQGIKNELKDEVTLIITALISILLILSNFKLGGKVGEAVNGFLFGVFGFLAYLFPVLLTVVVAFYLANKHSVTKNYLPKLISSIAIFALVAAMIQLAVGETTPGTRIVDYYKYAFEYKTGGGIIGGLLCRLLVPLFGLVGTWVVLAALELICLMIITGKAFLKLIREYVSDKHAENVQKRKELEEIYEEALENENRHDGRSRSKSFLFNYENKEDDDEEEITPVPRNFFGGVTPTKPVGLKTEDKEPKVKIRDVNERADTSETPVTDNKTEDLTAPKALDKELFEIGNDIGIDKDLNINGVSDRKTEELILNGKYTPSERMAKDIRTIYEEEKHSETKEMSFSDTALRDRGYMESASPRTIFDNEPYGGLIGKGSKAGVSLKNQDLTEEEFDAGDDGVNTKEDIAKGTEEAVNRERTIQRTKSARSAEAGKNVPTETLTVEQPDPIKQYVFPPIELLNKPQAKKSKNNEHELVDTAEKLTATLKSFGVNATVTDIARGPSVTRYELQPEEGVRVSRITNLADDIKLNLAASDIRIEAPIPGKAVIGIEVPNSENTVVTLREMIESDEFENTKGQIPFVVGKSIDGHSIVGDIAKMPHMLIAGSTGSGKSVCINTIIMSILYHLKPDDVKFIMIDPKIVELSVYNGIPHLLIPVVTDAKKAAAALNWACVEMDERYKKFAQLSVRDLKSYNARIREEAAKGNTEPDHFEMPQMVIIVDELADLMMVASNEVEDSINRLAAKARACGIHLIIATQRPSVNVITGVIKANIPSRIAFAVTSGVDSKTILDTVGAEKLLGKGDMLYFPSGLPKPLRIQGSYVSDSEITKVVDFLKNENEDVEYSDAVSEKIAKSAQESAGGAKALGAADSNDDSDDLFDEAAKCVIESGKASIGHLQRKFRIGFNRAARIMDALAEAGVVSEEDGTKPRQVLMTMEDYNSKFQQ